MTLTESLRETTLSVVYRQEPDALARVLSVLRRLRIHVEAVSSIPAGDGISCVVLSMRSPAYQAERARALISQLVPVLHVVEITAREPGAAGATAATVTNHDPRKGQNDGYDSL